MEERIPERQELQDPTPDIAAVPAEARSPSPPQAPSGDDDAAATVLSSGDETDVDSDGEFEFEFPFVSRDSPAGTAALADDLFADGCIRPTRPFYPVFGRGAGTDPAPAAPAVPRTRGPLGRLFLEESRARSSSTSSTASTSSSAATDDDGGLEGARPESYCLWTPGSRPGSSASVSSSPGPPRKSRSTGSMARWRRISERVVGRSHSDGKEKFLFLPTQPPKEIDREDKPKPKLKPKPKPKPNPPGGKKASAAAEVDTVTAAHRIAYSAKGSGVTGAGGAPRRTFLPYREELVGFFTNVNGISRSHPHPF